MYQEQTLYHYLYQALVFQISCGVFLQQHTLPSQKHLTQQYNVGITTVRKVIKMLHEEDYVRAISGQPAVVTYKASTKDYISALIARKEVVYDGFQGLGLLLPHLYREGAKHCEKGDLHIMRKAIADIDEHMDILLLYRQTNQFMRTLMQAFDNPLIVDLELDAENFLHIPFIPYHDLHDPFYRTAASVKGWLNNIYECILHQHLDRLYESISKTYQNSQYRVISYIQELEQCVDAIPASCEQHVYWFRIRDRSELYAHIAMKLLRRIIKGEFSQQKYIPSIPEIMKEYGVTKETASRTIALLNALGITRSIEKKGTVIRPDASARVIHIDFNDPLIVQRIRYCLYAIQLITLSMDICPALDPERKRRLFKDITHILKTISRNRIDPMLIQLLMDFIIESMPAQSLKNIYTQLNDLLVWGYYLEAADESLYPDPQKSTDTIQQLLMALNKGHDKEVARALKQTFLQIYRNVYSVVLKMPYDFGTLPVLL